MTHVQKETAVLLKEKGFDLPCRQYFIANKEEVQNTHDNFPINWNKHDDIFSAPKLHDVADWLRAKYYHVCVSDPWWDTYYDNDEWAVYVSCKGDRKIGHIGSFNTHDLALEAGIVHALKHYIK